MTLRAALLFLPVFPASLAAAQMPCQNRIVRGTVVDGTEALVPDADQVANGSALVLLVMVLVFNIVARVLGRQLTMRMTGKA